jgi:hypothetical protein
MTDVIVEVLGGVVQNVAVSGKDVRVVVVDWDNIGDAEETAGGDLEWEPVGDVESLAPETERLYRRLLKR